MQGDAWKRAGESRAPPPQAAPFEGMHLPRLGLRHGDCAAAVLPRAKIFPSRGE